MSKRSKLLNIVYGPETEATDGITKKPIPHLVLGTVTVTLEMEIGRHITPCKRCGKESPPPTSEQLRALAARGDEWVTALQGRYLGVSPHPRDDGWDSNEHYRPAGWQYIEGHFICETCVPVVRRALDEALKP